MTEDYTWVFDPDRDDGGIPVDRAGQTSGEAIEYHEIRIGGQMRLIFETWGGTDVAGDEGGTLGGDLDTAMTLGGSRGKTLGSMATKHSHIQRYKELRKYGEYAGQYHTSELLDGRNSITDRTPADADVNSVIVALVPGRGFQSLPAVWVGIDSYQDNTDIIEDGTSIQMQVTVLELLANYPTRNELLNAL